MGTIGIVIVYFPDLNHGGLGAMGSCGSTEAELIFLWKNWEKINSPTVSTRP
jgi:hypothetical protein